MQTTKPTPQELDEMEEFLRRRPDDIVVLIFDGAMHHSIRRDQPLTTTTLKVLRSFNPDAVLVLRPFRSLDGVMIYPDSPSEEL